MKFLASLLLLLVGPACFAGGVITYVPYPPVTAGIILNRDNIPAGTEVDARLTNGTDPYGFPSDKDERYVDGNRTYQYLNDPIQRVVWSVTVGTLGDSGLSTLESTTIEDRFHVVWHVPVGTAPGAYGITAKVYDEGVNGASARDSVDPNPVIKTAVLHVGEITYSAEPPIDFSIHAYPSNPATGQTVELDAVKYGYNEGFDQDYKYVGGVFAGYESDEVESVRWQVTDGNGVSAGILDGGMFHNEWTAPDTPGTYYITVTEDDRANGGKDVDDKPVTKTLAIAVGGGSAATTTRTEAQAIALAQTFCTAIGQPETGTATGRFPAPAPYDGAGATHYQPRWVVTFDDGAEVEVTDATGVITAYRNPGVIESMQDPNDPAGTAIPEAQALSTASSLLTSAGQTTELGTATATLNQMTEPPTKIGQTWTVVQPRVYSDPPYDPVPYLGQQATVILQGETGEVIGYGLTFPSEAPASAAGSVTATQADATATALLTAQGITGYTSGTPVKMAVRPNTAWEPNGTTDPLPGPAKVAWVCNYSDAITATVYKVFVDVSSGDVIGGEIATVRGRMKLPWQ